MVPVIANGGSSFKGAWLYYFHDKNARSTARVAWTATRNLMTECAEKAYKVMAFTAKAQARLKQAAGIANTGRKLEKPVFAYSLSWHPEQTPDQETMMKAARQSLEALGLSDHETMIAAHNDEPQPHIHIIVNRCHPLTGRAANMNHSKRKLSDFAREWERTEGKIYCVRREENYAKRQAGQPTKYVDPVINAAWANSEDVQGFIAQLQEASYDLAQGRKRLVVVDPHGKTINPIRHIEGVRAKAFNARMRGSLVENLPTPEDILAKREADQRDRSGAAQTAQTIGSIPPIGEIPQVQPIEPIIQEQASNAGESETSVSIEEQQPSAPDPDPEDPHAVRMNEQFNQHQTQTASLRQLHADRISYKRKALEKFYRFDEMSDQIKAMRRELNTAGLFKRLAWKFTRKDRIMVEQIIALEKTQANARARFNETIKGLERDRDRAMERLKTVQKRERKALKFRLERHPDPEISQSRSFDTPEIDNDRPDFRR